MAGPEELASIEKIYRDPLFNRTLSELHAMRGHGAVAAAKAEAFVDLISGRCSAGGRDKFRFTRNGENRIKNCRKVDLGCGYRIVCIHKDRRLVLLYMGTHDDCFRWIERHRTAEYDMDAVEDTAWIHVQPVRRDDADVFTSAADNGLSEQYEERLMKKIDDSVLRKVFSGLIDQRT